VDRVSTALNMELLQYLRWSVCFYDGQEHMEIFRGRLWEF